MLMQQTLSILHALRLTGMAQALTEQADLPEMATLAFDERFALLVEREKLSRDDRRLTRLLQVARFRHAACVEDVNFRVPRGLDRSLFLRLAAGDWIRQHEILLLVGPTGTGKSWLACALGHAACRQGATVRYVRLPRLLGDLAPARGDGSYGRLLQQFARTDLLILDLWEVRRNVESRAALLGDWPRQLHITRCLRAPQAIRGWRRSCAMRWRSTATRRAASLWQSPRVSCRGLRSRSDWSC